MDANVKEVAEADQAMPLPEEPATHRVIVELDGGRAFEVSFRREGEDLAPMGSALMSPPSEMAEIETALKRGLAWIRAEP